MDLFTDFPSVTKAQWLAQIERDLKGRSPLDPHWQVEGIEVDPFPHLEDLDWQPQGLWGNPGWEICEEIVVKSDYKVANRQALDALEGGAEAIRFVLSFRPGAKLKILLAGIDTSIVSLHFFLTNKDAEPDRLLFNLTQFSNPVRGSVAWKSNVIIGEGELASMIQFGQSDLPGFKVVTIFPDESNNAVSELASLLSKAVNLLNGLSENEEIDPSTFNRHLQFSLPIRQDFFVEIAKLRALRRLWANVLKGYGITKPAMPPIEATAFPLSQDTDPQKDMISATTLAMSAILGGADRLTIKPSDANGQYSAAFYRRIARNVQHILKVESHLDWVADPAAGSYFVEKLTCQLAESAWAAFSAKWK